MSGHAYFYRSVPGASFIVEDQSVWVRIEGRAGGYAMLDLGPVAENGAVNVAALDAWCERIAELARDLGAGTSAFSRNAAQPPSGDPDVKPGLGA